MQPIRPFFAKRDYADFDYVYAWTGWDPAQDSHIERSSLVRALMRDVEGIAWGKSPMSPSSYDHHNTISNKKAPPNAIAAARARQSTGKIFYPPIKAMNDVERYRLSTGNQKNDDDQNDEEAGIFDV